MKLSWPLTIVAASTALGLASAPATASADTTWLVNATFTGGGDLTGSFTIDQDGYLTAGSLTTTSGGGFPGYTYNFADSYFSNGDYYVDFQPGYQGDLHLAFADSLLVGSQYNPIVIGNLLPNASYECQGSFSCYDLGGGDTRFIGSGSAVYVPEPATWALALVGFAGLGAVLRGRRRLTLAGSAPGLPSRSARRREGWCGRSGSNRHGVSPNGF